MVRTAIYLVKEAFRGFYHAKLMTFVSILTVSFALFMLGAVGVAYLNLRLWLKDASNRVEIVGFVKDSIASDTAAVAGLMEQVRRLPQVAGAAYVDKKEAWKRFSEANGSRMLDAVDDNPFPASVEITVRESAQSVGQTALLQSGLERIAGIEDVQVSQQWVQFLQRCRNYFLAGGVCMALLLTLALNFMIGNTIKLTIYARQEIIRNMRFVGATNGYIKAPFILEGMLQGVVGAGAAATMLFLIKISPVSHFHIFWGPWYALLLIFPVGALFGCIGSMSAVRKFLA